ncbi:hypothetical protein B0H19DRAFT_1374501 [Mycena capillaripes]|nr:hypothetical protein B0H19DRAFT_1374501 [Mycena capillaripes]
MPRSNDLRTPTKYDSDPFWVRFPSQFSFALLALSSFSISTPLFHFSPPQSLSFFPTALVTYILTSSSVILRVRTPSASQVSRGREPALVTIFSSTSVRTAESCLFGRPRRLLHTTTPRASLAFRCDHLQHHDARAIRPTTWKPPQGDEAGGQ